MRTALTNVTVVDPENRELRPRRTLIFENGKVLAEVPAEEPLDANLQVIDGNGRFATPGLIDAHIHLQITHVGPLASNPSPSLAGEGTPTPFTDYIARAQTYLYCGVTSVYDAGNDPEVIFTLRDGEISGEYVVPRIYATGNLLTAPGGHGSGAAVAVPADGDIEGIVAKHQELNPDVVKITYDEHGWGIRPVVPILEPSTLKRTIDAVHAHGKKVTVHVSHEQRAREAVAAGADILAHPVIQSPMNESFADELAAAAIPVVSTLTIGARYPRLADDPTYVDGPLYKECETQEVRERLRTEESAVQKGNRWADWMRIMTPVAQENIRVLVERGVTVGAGTDQAFGPDYHRELELLSQAGIANWDVLRAATVGAAKCVDREGQIGTLAPGAWGDLVLTDEDPTQDIATLRSLAAVFKNGEEIDRSALDIPANRGE